MRKEDGHSREEREQGPQDPSGRRGVLHPAPGYRQVQKARVPELQYFIHMEVSEKVLAQQARDGGYQVLGVR